MIRKIFVPLALAASALFVLAACGGDDNGSYVGDDGYTTLEDNNMHYVYSDALDTVVFGSNERGHLPAKLYELEKELDRLSAEMTTLGGEMTALGAKMGLAGAERRFQELEELGVEMEKLGYKMEALGLEMTPIAEKRNKIGAEIIKAVGNFWEDWWSLRGYFDLDYLYVVQSIGGLEALGWARALPGAIFQSLEDIQSYLLQFYTEDGLDMTQFSYVF